MQPTRKRAKMIELNDENRKALAKLGFSNDGIHDVVAGLDDWYNLALDAAKKYRGGYHDTSALQGDLLQGDHGVTYGNGIGVWYDARISRDGQPAASAMIWRLDSSGEFPDNSKVDPVLVIDTDDEDETVEGLNGTL